MKAIIHILKLDGSRVDFWINDFHIEDVFKIAHSQPMHYFDFNIMPDIGHWNLDNDFIHCYIKGYNSEEECIKDTRLFDYFK